MYSPMTPAQHAGWQNSSMNPIMQAMMQAALKPPTPNPNGFGRGLPAPQNPNPAAAPEGLQGLPPALRMAMMMQGQTSVPQASGITGSLFDGQAMPGATKGVASLPQGFDLNAILQSIGGLRL